MDTLCQFGIAIGQWIFGHTLAVYPMESISALAFMLVAMVVYVSWSLER